MTLLPACPLMHGTGGFTVARVPERGRPGGDPDLPAVRSRSSCSTRCEREKVNGLIIVGDAFAKPILATLDAHPGRWDLTSLVGIISSGRDVERGDQAGPPPPPPDMLLVDAFSSSEAIGMGSSVSSGDSAARTAQFTLGPEVRVIDSDGRDVVPGSGRSGVLALGGRIPLGYYKDEAKTAATFRTIDGTRYSIPGDFAEVGEDGSIHLLGRGSVVINTGGEKVYPEEVEEVVKTIDQVADAVVVGLPNERFGEEIVAVVELAPGAPTGSVRPEQVIDHVKARLAGYKAPRRVRFVDTIGRSPAGKVDYARHRAEAAAWAGDPARLSPGRRGRQPLLAPWVRTKSLTV